MGIRILLTGGSGQVGRAVYRLLSTHEGVEVFAPDRSAFPLDRPRELANLLDSVDPAVVLHLGAFTAVDRAEQEPEMAYRVNRDAADAIARWCGAQRRPMLYVSTDFVFDGEAPPDRPRALWRRRGYEVTDPPCPLNVYGASKLAGEEAVHAHAPNHWIVRTSWVFAPGGSNFPTAILRQAAARRPIRVVIDQLGRPTYAPDLAEALLRLVGLGERQGAAPWGTYHITNSGIASWYAIAVETLERAGWAANVEPVTSQEFGAVATRPERSLLSTQSTRELGIQLRPWRSAVRRFVTEMANVAPSLLPAREGDGT